MDDGFAQAFALMLWLNCNVDNLIKKAIANDAPHSDSSRTQPGYHPHNRLRQSDLSRGCTSWAKPSGTPQTAIIIY